MGPRVLRTGFSANRSKIKVWAFGVQVWRLLSSLFPFMTFDPRQRRHNYARRALHQPKRHCQDTICHLDRAQAPWITARDPVPAEGPMYSKGTCSDLHGSWPELLFPKGGKLQRHAQHNRNHNRGTRMRSIQGQCQRGSRDRSRLRQDATCASGPPAEVHPAEILRPSIFVPC